MGDHEGFEDAYLEHVADLLHAPAYRNAPRGLPSQEKLAVRIRIADPLRRVVTHPARRTNIVFNFAEALWYLSGRNDLEYLSYYAPRVARYSADGRHLSGTAYGPRIFQHGPHLIDQWASVVDVLRSDLDSRRAVIQIFQPEELLIPHNPDVACTLAIQFLVREGQLHAITFMRANDIYRGMLGDVFSFSFLQEIMARQLGVALGSYTHIAGSLHLYQEDVDAARRVVETPRPVGLPDDRMPALPRGSPRETLKRVLEFESEIRHDTLRLDDGSVDRLDVPEYWRQVLVLLELYRHFRHGGGSPRPLLGRLDPLYRYLILNKFPSLGH